MNANLHRVALLALGGVFVVASGCTIGKSADGQIGPMVPFGTLIETGQEALVAGIGALFPGAGTILPAALGVLGIGAAGWAKTATRASAESAARVAEKRAWDEATAYHHALNAPPPARPAPTIDPQPPSGQPSGGSAAQGA